MSGQNDVAILTYELMKRMNANLQTLTLEVGDLKMGMSAREEHMRATVTSITGMNARLDRVDERLGRIERRLDLREGLDS